MFLKEIIVSWRDTEVPTLGTYREELVYIFRIRHFLDIHDLPFAYQETRLFGDAQQMLVDKDFIVFIKIRVLGYLLYGLLGQELA